MRKKFACSYDRIELVISYYCNMQCNNCDAMVPQAPTKEAMTVEQIKKFIDESIHNNVHWQHIRVLGGEPSLHKNIYEILDLLIEYKRNFSPETRLIIVTNGHGPLVKKRLEGIPIEVEVENSHKESNVQPTFSTVNVAPVDLAEFEGSDFSKGCWIPALCGITLDHNGYYPCSAAAAIDRVFGLDLGQKSMPASEGTLERNFESFCKYCGHFYDKINHHAQEDITTKSARETYEIIHQANFEATQKDNQLIEQVNSQTWDLALKNYKKRKPIFEKY